MKIAEINDIKEDKMEEEIKEWKTQSCKGHVASILMTDRVSFSYDEENGIVFTAPDFYVENMIYRLMTAYGIRKRPVIEEY